MQNIVIAITYRFVPPRFSPFWARIIQWYLPTYLRKSFGITSWACAGAERLVTSLNAGSGALAAFFAAAVAGRLSPALDTWLR